MPRTSGRSRNAGYFRTPPRANRFRSSRADSSPGVHALQSPFDQLIFGSSFSAFSGMDSGQRAGAGNWDGEAPGAPICSARAKHAFQNAVNTRNGLSAAFRISPGSNSSAELNDCVGNSRAMTVSRAISAGS